MQLSLARAHGGSTTTCFAVPTTHRDSGVAHRCADQRMVDDESATRATWLGVSLSDLAKVLPNIGRWAKPNLGFMS